MSDGNSAGDGNSLRCVLPWKALFMDERDGHLSALPCCANWINRSYGPITAGTSLEDLWNGEGAQEIRRLMATGRQSEMCAEDCPWLVSGRFAESAQQVLPGPEAYEANQRLNQEEIRERRTHLKSQPMVLRLIPTLKCNIRCRMCHQDHTADLQLPAQLLADVRKLGPYLYDYQLHGGEVLVANRFAEWADPDWFDSHPQMLLSLITNATHLSPRIWQVLQRVRINYITVSINAASRATYRFMAEADLYYDVLGNVEKLRELGRDHALQPFQVYLSFVIMRCNYHELMDFVQLANRLEMPFRLLLVVGDRLGESIYDSPEILRNVLAAAEAAEALTPPASLLEVTRIQQSLRESLTTSQFPERCP